MAQECAYNPNNTNTALDKAVREGKRTMQEFAHLSFLLLLVLVLKVLIFLELAPSRLDDEQFRYQIETRVILVLVQVYTRVSYTCVCKEYITWECDTQLPESTS